MSLFITLEGGEGSGKSIQSKILYRRLSRMGIPTVLTYEPGGTSLGKKLGRLLKWANDEPFSPIAELLLFSAARAQSVTKVIRPSLNSGKVVISDRYVDSTTVYQGYGRGLNLDKIKVINDTATQGLMPDLSILLDIPAEAGLIRKKETAPDRFEQENLSFHNRVCQGYLYLAAEEPNRWIVIDALQERDKIARIIWKRVSKMLNLVGE